MAGTCAEALEAVSWNMAAINNNPFEYWISYGNEAYGKLMEDVQGFIENPGDRDVPVCAVFSDSMFTELKELMLDHGWDQKHVQETEAHWEGEYRDRRIISGFMKDSTIGSKRLASMPDRITNTINLANGKQAFRPTAINCYEDEFESLEDWWEKWKTFMFKNKLEISSKGSVKNMKVVDMLLPINKSKYPAISEEEEAISLPLQVLCEAVFDAILIHMLGHLSGKDWQKLRFELSTALNKKKNDRLLEILSSTYMNSDVIFLQEVANAFVTQLKEHSKLKDRFEVMCPEVSGKRDQLSIILLSKHAFDISSLNDVTPLVDKKFEGKSVPVAEGDLAAATAKLKDADDVYLLASFHGDTNGLATIPVVAAVLEVEQDLGKTTKLLFGLDANTYEVSKPGKNQGVKEFAEWFVSKNLTSCWGDTPDPTAYTTYNARTFLQPQLNKAASKNEFKSKGDVNPKDFILFHKNHFSPQSPAVRDNNGDRTFTKEMVFPTLQFPSDHAVISVKLSKI